MDISHLIIFLLVMLATCIGTATYSLFLVALTFTKEMLIHKASAQRQGQAIVSQSHILEVYCYFFMYNFPRLPTNFYRSGHQLGKCTLFKDY